MEVRKSIALAGLLVLLTAVGCNSSDNTRQANGAESPETPPKSNKIAILLDRGNTAFANAVRDGITAAADEYNVEVEFMAGAANAAEQQVTLLNKAIEERCRGICIFPIDPATVVDRLSAAAEAGIPVVTFGEAVSDEVTVVSHASTDQFHAGRLIAEFVAGQLADDAKVLLIDCRSDDESRTRRNGFSYAAEKELEKFELISVDCGEDLAGSIDASLNEHDDVAAIVAFNVISSQAALEVMAQRTAQQEILICGYGSWDGVQMAINDEKLAATMLEDPYMIGFSAVMAIANHLSGENVVGEYITTGERVISKENLDTPTAMRLLESNFRKSDGEGTTSEG